MVAPMVRKLAATALVALALTIQGCGKTPADNGAAGAAQAFLAAAWSGDLKGFEAGLDRTAVRADLRQQLMQVAQANSLAVEGGASDAALDRMITPDAFRLVAAGSGAPLAAAPSKAQTAALIKPLGKDRACVHDQSPQQACLLTFAKEAKSWRLVAMAPAGFTIPVGPEPAKTAS
jgi:hypothetical protein